MPGFLDQLRQTKDKAALEADKLIRVHREQNAIDQLRREIREQQDRLGVTALALFRKNELSHPQLTAICSQIEGLEGQIKQREDRIEEIRAEELAVEAPPQGLVCTRCGALIPAGAAFCQNCGAPAPKPAPEPAPEPQAICEGCGNPIDPAAVFCPHCGRRRTPAEPAPRCANCGAQLAVGATFCPECGARVGQAAAAPVPVEAVAAEPPVVPEPAPIAELPAVPLPEVEPPAVPLPEVEPPAAAVPAAEEPAPAGKVCPACGYSLPEDAVFCPECGYRLS